jgi:hypothetical protein
MYREDEEALAIRERELSAERDALAARVGLLESAVPRPPRPAWLRMIRRNVWVVLMPALMVGILVVAYLAMKPPGPPPSMRCANGDHAACRGLPTEDDALLIACAGGDTAACASAPDGAAALGRLCELGVIADCRAAAALATGADAVTVLREGCLFEDAQACIELAAHVAAGDGTYADPVYAAGLVRSACLLDASTCLTYGDQQAAAGAADVAANAWQRACGAGVTAACGRSR